MVNEHDELCPLGPCHCEFLKYVRTTLAAKVSALPVSLLAVSLDEAYELEEVLSRDPVLDLILGRASV